MSLVVFENNSNGTLLADINNSVTSIVLASGQGANFPTISGDEVFYITLQNYAAQLVEICQVTARSVDTLTVVRGHDGTSAKAWAIADTAIQLRLTKETLEKFVQVDSITPPSTGDILTVDAQGQLVTRTDPVTTSITYEDYTATEGQDVFNTTVDLPTIATGIVLFINGVRQFPPNNFTRTGLNQITIDETLAVGDALVIGA